MLHNKSQQGQRCGIIKGSSGLLARKYLNQGVQRNRVGNHSEVNNCGIVYWEQVFYATIYG